MIYLELTSFDNEYNPLLLTWHSASIVTIFQSAKCMHCCSRITQSHKKNTSRKLSFLISSVYSTLKYYVQQTGEKLKHSWMTDQKSWRFKGCKNVSGIVLIDFSCILAQIEKTGKFCLFSIEFFFFPFFCNNFHFYKS